MPGASTGTDRLKLNYSHYTKVNILIVCAGFHGNDVAFPGLPVFVRIDTGQRILHFRVSSATEFPDDDTLSYVA